MNGFIAWGGKLGWPNELVAFTFDTEDEKRANCNNIGVDVVFSVPFVRVLARKFISVPSSNHLWAGLKKK